MPEQDVLLIAQRFASDAGIPLERYDDLPSEVKAKALEIAETLLEAKRERDEGRVQELEGDLAYEFERFIDALADEGIRI